MDLANYAHDEGLVPALFNYNSYEGVEAAALHLGTRIASIWSDEHKPGYALVGHSMGGLVALDFACSLASPAPLKSIALLGTPNAGVPNRRLFSDGSPCGKL